MTLLLDCQYSKRFGSCPSQTHLTYLANNRGAESSISEQGNNTELDTGPSRTKRKCCITRKSKFATSTHVHLNGEGQVIKINQKGLHTLSDLFVLIVLVNRPVYKSIGLYKHFVCIYDLKK